MSITINHLKHNKKRNIGLINEFFAKHMALCVIEKRFEELEKSKHVWQKYMSSSTNNELLKEWKVFESLLTTKVESNEVAYSLMNNLKNVVQKQNIKDLNDQKTRMIHEVNNLVKDEKFFERDVKDYRTMATIQTLINSWREVSNNPTNIEAIKLVAQLEEQVINHLTKKNDVIVEDKEATLEEVLEYGDEEISGLILNLMNEKFTKTYSDTLTEEQKKILNLYLFSSDPSLSSLDLNTSNQLNLFLESLRDQTIKLIERECVGNHNKLIVEKYTSIKNVLNSDSYKDLTVKKLNDDMITFFMSVSKLKEELLTTEEVQ